LIQIEMIQILDKLERSIRARKEGKLARKALRAACKRAPAGRSASGQMPAIPQDG
jgi:hypothetical protein